VRSVVTGALEVERVQKRIGSPLESAPTVYVSDEAQLAALEGVDLAEVCITSGVELVAGEPPDGSFRLEAVAGVGVAHRRAPGVKCARSWRYFDPATTDDAYPDVTPRDAAALRELGAMATA
jgi:isoleucyl-tRNA synthetase